MKSIATVFSKGKRSGSGISILAAVLAGSFFLSSSNVNAEQINIDRAGQQQNITKSATPVFFVTDRQETIHNDRAKFTGERSAELNYGICYPDAERADGKRKLLVFHSPEQFFSELSRYAKNGAIIFVHGYRRNFSGSIDLACEASQKLGKPLIVFSWPAQNMYVKYFVDETNAEWAGHHFADFLTELGSRIDNKNIMIISHSLGARVVTSAFQTIATDRLVSSVPPFGKVLFCSPDIDRDIFAEQSWLMRKMTSDLRVYVSSRDKRICISNVVHGSPRLGWANKHGIGAIDGVEIIDFKADDHRRFGHSIPYSILTHVVRENYQSAYKTRDPSLSTTTSHVHNSTGHGEVGRD